MWGTEDRVKKVICDRLAVTETLPIATQTDRIDPSASPKTKQTRKSSDPEVLALLQAAIDMSILSLSWGQFMRLVGLDKNEPKKASNADIALSLAAGMGVPISPKNSSIAGWYFTANKAFAVRQQ